MNTAHNVTWRDMNPTAGLVPRPLFEVPARIGHGGQAVVAAFAGLGLLLVAARADLAVLVESALGRALLFPCALALCAWAGWRTLELAVDPERVSTDARGMSRRVGAGVSGVVHAGLAGLLGSIALGGDAALVREVLPRLLQSPFGPLLVVALALFTLPAAAFELRRALVGPWTTRLDLARMSRRERRLARDLGRTGALARAVAMPLCGFVVAAAALSLAEPGALLGSLVAHPGGAAALVALALGLWAHAAHHAFLARYRLVPRRSFPR